LGLAGGSAGFFVTRFTGQDFLPSRRRPFLAKRTVDCLAHYDSRSQIVEPFRAVQRVCDAARKAVELAGW